MKNRCVPLWFFALFLALVAVPCSQPLTNGLAPVAPAGCNSRNLNESAVNPTAANGMKAAPLNADNGVTNIPPVATPFYNIVFVGDSITFGATLSDPATQASSVQCMQSLIHRFKVAVSMSNQGHSGHTTADWLPSTNSASDFQLAIAAAASLESRRPGQLVFSIMLGANDSAQSGPNQSPVSPAIYQQNLRSIVGQLLAIYPNAYIFVHYPTWYSPNTQNSSLYGSAGLARLKTYLPEIDRLISNCASAHPGRVFAGDKIAFNRFSINYLTELTPEHGVQGTFYLHPNLAGAIHLGKDGPTRSRHL